MKPGDRGQATVEFALVLPVVCVLLCGVLQTALVVRDVLVVHHAAREAARAASVSAEPGSAAASAIAHLHGSAPLTVSVAEAGGRVTATVRTTARTDVPLVGPLLPDLDLVASVTMTAEPP